MSRTGEALKRKQEESAKQTKVQASPAPAKVYANSWNEAAAEAGGNDLGKLLKFVKGKWETGADVIAEGSEYVAHIDQLVRGWVRFEDGKVVDRNIGKLA